MALPPSPRIRLAELIVPLSTVADLGMGLPVGSAARTAWVAVELARIAGCAESEVSEVFYAALLQHIGCTAFSHEVAAWFDDEFSVKRAGMATDFTRPREIITGYFPSVVRGAPAGSRLRALRSAVLHSQQMTDGYMLANCEAAAVIAQRLGLPAGVRAGLLDAFEWFNGGGGPKKLAGQQISMVARIVNVAGYAVFFDSAGGLDAALYAIRRRSGTYLDPDVCAHFDRNAQEWLGAFDAGEFSDRLLAAEPRPQLLVDDLESVLGTFGEAVDVKAPFLHGHSSAVSTLAEGAAHRLGLDVRQITNARRAGLVQDLGRVAVANGIWEHPGPLGSDGWMQVRLHAYHGEQILNRCAPLRELAPLAGMHHDRLDGSGYHRGAGSAQIAMVSRILAAADSYQALITARPHRAALPTEAAGRLLRAEARAGRLDPDAVAAVLGAATDAPIARRFGQAGLTERQIAVLRLLAAGLSNRRIGEELVISPRTAEHHVQDVYSRIGVSSRAAAALYAMQHRLL